MNKFVKGKKDKINGIPKSDSGIKEDVERALKRSISSEITAAKQNLDSLFKESDTYYDMVHCKRDKSKDDDEYNVYIPEYLARLLTQIGNFCSQYFSSRDYVDVYLESEDPIDVAESKASKKLLNAILNTPELHYYYKIVRLMMSVYTRGYGIIKGYYRQRVEQYISGYNPVEEFVQNDAGEYLDIDGSPFTDPYSQEPMISTSQEPIYAERVVEDRPDFDFYPIKDVLFSPEFTYSLADKKYVIFKAADKKINEIEADKEVMGYFNLNILRDKAKKERISEDGKTVHEEYPSFTLYERYGKAYAVVKERDEKNRPTSIMPGVDKDGKKIDGAELIDIIQTTASWENDDVDNSVLIRYQASKHSRMPVVRFISYIDENMDTGFGDGESSVGVQGAINDNFNLAFYRTSLASKPFFKGKKWAGIPDKIRVHSEEVLLLEDINDLAEFQIADNPSGALALHQGLANQLDRITGASPQTMGDAADRKETATVGSIINQRANIRMGLKNLNLEFIGFTELYNMLLTLCNDFMLPQTLQDMIGDLVFAYNPKRKDKFKPVSQAIETEESKQFKIKTWQTLAGQVVSMGAYNPKTPIALNMIIGQILELMGSSYKAFGKFLFEEDPQKITQWLTLTGSKGMAAQGAQDQNMNPSQNQYGNPMTPQELQPRGMV